MGFFGFGVIPGGVVSGSVLGSRGLFGPNFIPSAASGPTSSTLIVGGPNSTGPYIYGASGDGTGFYDGTTNGGTSIGGANPPPVIFNGKTVDVIAWSGNLVEIGATGFTVAIAGALAQNFFTSIALGAPANLTFLTAAAGAFTTLAVPGFGIWQWADGNEFSFLGAHIPTDIS